MEQKTPGIWDKAGMAAAYARLKIEGLQSTNNESLARATLAKLRRGIGKPPGSLPQLWEETLGGMPEALAGFDGCPSAGEWACTLALTLFALHQQGSVRQSAPMHKDGQSLGQAVRKLIKDKDDEGRIKRRFDRVVTADSPEELSHHLRGIIQLLRAGDIPLDYAALAHDLYLFQIPQTRDSVRLRWGRDYCRMTPVAPNAPADNQTTEREDITHGE